MRKRNEWSFTKRNEWSFTPSVEFVMSITDTTITNVNIIPNGAGVRNIKCEPVKKF
jgi:hypothetical protein